MKCTCCGQELPPKVDLGSLKLSPLKKRIWDAVNSFPGMTVWEIMDWVYGHNPNGGREDPHNIYTNVNQINRKISFLGVEISNADRQGYRVRAVQ